VLYKEHHFFQLRVFAAKASGISGHQGQSRGWYRFIDFVFARKKRGHAGRAKQGDN
jgi:hypothetical protein